ncbi:MAG TPA: hypothetical protein P5155_01480 [Candidatus Absconditabacterales bacterium]|nr:hypothetical protein [Candidatus Absconditabacterales bacterium]
MDRAIELLKNNRLSIEEIAELSKILIELSIEQGKFGELSAEQEYKYNLDKYKLITKGLQTGIPYNRAEALALKEVEQKYGEYRINRAKNKKFYSICTRLENYIKLEMHRNKLDIMAQDVSIDLD